jgi:hypothetical protein
MKIIFSQFNLLQIIQISKTIIKKDLEKRVILSLEIRSRIKIFLEMMDPEPYKHVCLSRYMLRAHPISLFY